ncbi:MAG TPA: SHOCT domain-containing protein [Kofleriaceae bacterium]|nr:SHOCT domain-containing protein [Kofleriaceae bacterium]
MAIAWFLLGAITVLMLGSLMPSDEDDSPDEILKQRYARGEIDRATFERMREDLHGAAHS